MMRPRVLSGQLVVIGLSHTQAIVIGMEYLSAKMVLLASLILQTMACQEH